MFNPVRIRGGSAAVTRAARESDATREASTTF